MDSTYASSISRQAPHPRAIVRPIRREPADEMDEKDSDEQLVLQAGRGDRAACQELVRRHLSKILSFATRMAGDREIAQDIAQEVFLRLWTHARDWRLGTGRLTTWLHRVALNLCIDRHQRRKEAPLDEGQEAIDPSPASLEIVRRKEVARHVERALQALPESQRSAVVLCHYQDLRNSEAAEIMGIHVEALESLLARGRRRLREQLQPLMPDLLGGEG